ncbi:YifB family Mg chelatase-like AAA ATPase [uncultured Rikenella sp.]|uniref:YifB family Mg chelatase-like AAA ATPase n=1 Tax=uncultured Rikenella sp. TaxID=368003 RepID=UPI00263330CD|nr:YifB family Mg chelatase-like AAA ATPase [uncultured Rikenella sp.]
MLVKTYSSTVEGIDARTITVEVNLSPGIRFLVVGLPDNAVKESQQRITAAFANNKLHMPGFNILVNMAPADMRKIGSHYDLPIAVGILAASKQVAAEPMLGKYILIGELSLDGTLLPVKGALPIAVQAWKEGFEGIVLPAANAREAAVVQNLKVYGVDHLMQVVALLNGESDLQPTTIDTRAEYFSRLDDFDMDFQDVKGQGEVKRALEIAAAGGHNVLMIGPPGAGKSMLAKRMPTITPPMTLAEALETTKIHSVAGKLGDDSRGGLLTARPFRAPHHITSEVALVGGSVPPQPGEISLAHNGILFLDELPEFNRKTLEVLRQPLDEKRITISRAKYSVDYPANFMLIAAMNPCPCGYRTHPDKVCTCTPAAQARYMSKISGPLMDRIDIQVEVIPVAVESMTRQLREGETSAQIRKRVTAARERQTRRLQRDGYAQTHCNAMLTPEQIERYCRLDDESIELVQNAMTTMGLSGRAYDRILKVARTIADLAGAENIAVDHVAEAIQYRSLDCNHLSDN